jgi:hypothetical protein
MVVARIGKQFAIEWTSEDWLDNDDNPLPPFLVSIELSRNGGLSWESIIASTDNTGIYSWVATGPVSSNCVIRVTNLTEPSYNSISSVFSIGSVSTFVTVMFGSHL